MNMTRLICTQTLALVLLAGANAAAQPAAGPLRVHPENPRYFTDGSGRAILLTGSHTWNNLVDMGPTDPPAAFDYDAYLDWLAKRHHNFFRLWTWELLSWDTRGNREEKAVKHFVAPQPWKRTGPGKALDGKPKFDLEQFDDEYFTRLRDRVRAAQDRGLYAGRHVVRRLGPAVFAGRLEEPPVPSGQQHQRRQWRPGRRRDGPGNPYRPEPENHRTCSKRMCAR